MAPVESVGKTTCDMNTFHPWPPLPRGATLLAEPYKTASARPGPPPLSQGKTLTESPVADEPSLTCTGGVQSVHPDAADAALTYTWRWPGFEDAASSAQATKRLRAVSIEATVKRTSGSPGRWPAMRTSFE